MIRKLCVVMVGAAFVFACTVSDSGLQVSPDGTPTTGGASGGDDDAGMAGAAGGTAGTAMPLPGGSGGSVTKPDGGQTDAPALPCVGATGFGKSPGQTCACAGECASGFCADGVCCEEACSGACRTCASAADKGRCRLVEQNAKDPHNVCAAQGANTCGTTGQCDGQGACSKHAKGTTCGDAESCQGTVSRGRGSCDGAGACTPAAPVDCSPYVCGAAACLARCASNNDCASGFTCANGQCEGRRNDAASCTENSQCVSNFCVDGVCCNEACGGQCRSCALANSRGQCRLIPAGQMADAGECNATAASTCGRSGACDGQGQCAVYAQGTVCAAASCVANQARAASICNGAGSCVAGEAKSCSPYVCGGSATCLERCSNDAGCTGGNICVLSACGSYPILEIPFKAAPAVIDGNLDPAWATASAPQSISKYVFGASVNNFDAQFRAFWSPLGLHILVIVEDAQRVNDSEGQASYDDDTVEVYIDADGSRGTTLDGMNDHHFLFGWNDTVPQNVSLRRVEGVVYGQNQAANGYGIEITFPWITLGTTANAGKVFGLDVHVNDDDNGGLRERKVAWFTTQDTSFRDPSSYGRVRLAAP